MVNKKVERNTKQNNLIDKHSYDKEKIEESDTFFDGKDSPTEFMHLPCVTMEPLSLSLNTSKSDFDLDFQNISHFPETEKNDQEIPGNARKSLKK